MAALPAPHHPWVPAFAGMTSCSLRLMLWLLTVPLPFVRPGHPHPGTPS